MKAPEEEHLSIVDAEDRVIGMATRETIHRLGLRHRSVHILVFNSKDEVLLQQRAAHKTINPGLWDTSAAGHVEAGERCLAAAHRELEEELGICSERPLTWVTTLTAAPDTGWEFIQVYQLHWDGALRAEGKEISATQWVSREEINTRVRADDSTLTGTFKRLWLAFLQADSPL